MRHLILAFILLFPPLLQAALPSPVAKALREANIPRDGVSLFVQRVDKTAPLLQHEADVARNPASTMKLVTTYAALASLGPAYTWRTEFYSAAPLQGEVLNGDLYLKGYGDPALTLERFWELVRALRKAGVREIKGDLLLDRGYFNPGPHDPGQFDGEPYRAYNAGPDALLVNFKATRFDFQGDAATGRVLVTADPELPQLKILNQLELRQVPCADWKDRLGYRVEKSGEQVTVTFSGNYSLACGAKSLELSVFDDAVYISQLFRQLWQEQGGILRGGIKPGMVPDGARRLAQVMSPPLADVIRMVNKYSNNVMARQILLTLGAERDGQAGTAASGAAAVRAALEQRGLDFPELVLDNGAGLSRDERISARHMGALLMSAWRSPVMPELMASLPVVAVDGTLRHRLNNSVVSGQAHLKTGSLDGARSIAGYLLDRKGRRWVVVFMVNHARAVAAGAAQDALLEWLHNRD